MISLLVSSALATPTDPTLFCSTATMRSTQLCDCLSDRAWLDDVAWAGDQGLTAGTCFDVNLAIDELVRLGVSPSTRSTGRSALVGVGQALVDDLDVPGADYSWFLGGNILVSHADADDGMRRPMPRALFPWAIEDLDGHRLATGGWCSPQTPATSDYLVENDHITGYLLMFPDGVMWKVPLQPQAFAPMRCPFHGTETE